MSASKEQFIRATGGFRLGETPGAFRARVREIQEIERFIKSGKVKLEKGLELAQRRLCELKGINFDDTDDLE